jgi:hypothetical protein
MLAAYFLSALFKAGSINEIDVPCPTSLSSNMNPL